MHIILSVVLAAIAGGAAAPYAARTPLPTPAVFAPDVISTGDFETHPAFTPDGKALYFLKSAPNFTFWTMVVSRFDKGRWQSPTVAPWSGQYRDADPFITADGKHFYFISDRPVDGKPKEDLDIWMMEKRGDGWGEPRHLDAPVNSAGEEWFPTVASDGTIYFGSDREGGRGRTDIYRCRLNSDGTYGAAENLGEAINSEFDEFEPLIAPDQSFLIFMASGRHDGEGRGDLFVSVARDGKFQPARNLEVVNTPAMEISPKISPDGRWFFFGSTRGQFTGKPLASRVDTEGLNRILRGPNNGLGDIYQVDFSALGIAP